MKNPESTINLQAIVPENLAGKRLDQAVAELFSAYSRVRLQDWIRHGQLLVDGKQKRPRDAVHTGDTLTLQAVLPVQQQWEAQAIPLDIIHEDESLLIVNKPVGLVVHPAAGNPDRTLLNALLNHCPELAQLPRAGIIHRLDKDTSGLLVIAKTLPAHTELVRQLRAKTIVREYEAIVNGILISGSTVDAPIGRHPVHRKKMAVTELGKPARTHYRVLERFRAHTRLRVRLETGRTHQIRVHMAHNHHPLLGDKIYGPRLQLPKGASPELIGQLKHYHHQALHAWRLELTHPLTKKIVEWTAPLPADMQKLLEILRNDKLLA